MKGRVIVIDMPDDRPSQAALVVDGRLEDLILDPPKGDAALAPGTVCAAKVDRLAPKIGGAFLRLDGGATGFLREAKGLREGAGLVVQVTGHPEPGKAVPVTARVLYKGPRLIHTPGAPGINVSRQIRDADERARLVAIIESAEGAAKLEDGGVILRSAAEGADAEELLAELGWLLARRRETEAGGRPAGAGERPEPGRAIEDGLREWAFPRAEIAASPAFGRMLASDASGAFLWGSEELRRMVRETDADPFEHFGVWDEIERLKSPRVDLPSGAWMSVEPTRAMVTVDVNTGDNFNPAAALTANLEAAKELPRQLRLRGLGGQVAVDFAPLRKMDRKRVEDALKTSFRRDPIETTLAGWTPLGNFELQRKRERRPLAELLAK